MNLRLINVEEHNQGVTIILGKLIPSALNVMIFWAILYSSVYDVIVPVPDWWLSLIFVQLE